ncbi:NmrA family protein [Coprinopsis marcescibilis]|uniref:NmrA family protein n=1 Tax=Coprinopsis marcescibilis TaxID=230819 RepID=A0A5C3KGU6_COPMA|nr:NmrA family protein [Coprinopsis marcescibilis]
MTTLITGGASKIGVALAKSLQADGRDVLFASRSGRVPDGFKSVKLDWDERSTFENPFGSEKGQIQSVYLLPPPATPDPSIILNSFIDIAVNKDVKRIVVLFSSVVERKKSGIEYLILRPTWFIDNFITNHGFNIRTKDTFVTAVPTGKVPLVAIQDIATAAYEAIVAEKLPAKDKVIVGPEAKTYDEWANVLSGVLGRTIIHQKTPRGNLIDMYKQFGIPAAYAEWLTEIEQRVESGWEHDMLQKLEEGEKERLFVGTVTVESWATENAKELKSEG